MVAFKFNMAVFITMVASMALCSLAVEHAVGEEEGWHIPFNNPNLYTDWASKRTFTVGDSLMFDFFTVLHEVAEVSKEEYDSCHVNDPGSIKRDSPATFKLTSDGDHYYICSSLQGGDHCMLNQKLAIHVVQADTTTPSLGV